MIILVVALVILLPASAQQYTLTPLTTQSQLPVANIHAILQDSEGFMWYATRDGGLCRDDGYHIDVFRSDRFHPGQIGDSNDILCLGEDSCHHIVFGTRDGLYAIDKQDYSVFLVDEELKGKNVGALIVARDGTLWVSSNHQVLHYDRQLHRLQAYTCLWQGEKKWISRMMQTEDDTLWITLWGGGVISFSPEDKCFSEQHWLSKFIPMNLVDDALHREYYWVGTWGNGIVRYNPTDKSIVPQSVTTSEGEYASQVIHLARQGNRLFASTMYGLKVYDITADGRLNAVDMSDVLPHKMGITDYVTIDNRERIWVAGFSPHTFVLSPKRSDILRHDFDSIVGSSRFIAWCSADEEEVTWIGLERHILCLYDRTMQRMLSVRNAGISDINELNMVRFNRCLHQQGIWTHSEHNVYHIWYEAGRIKSQTVATLSEHINTLYESTDGTLYIAHQEGIDILPYNDTVTRRLISFKEGINNLIQTEDDILYFCSAGKFYRKEKDNQPQLLASEGEFVSIAIDSDGKVWCTGRQGILLCYNSKDGTIQIDTKGSNNKGDGIQDLAIDSLGHLWLLSDQELKEYSPRSGNYRLIYASEDDVRMDYFHHICCQEGKIRVDGAGALLDLVPTEALDQQKSVAEARVTCVSVDDKSHLVGIFQRSIEIPSDAVNVEILFSSLNFFHNEQVIYAYRIKQLDNEWHYLPQGTNKASFVRFSKGTYTIECMATDENGCWGRPVTVFTLHRLPAWYETGWAYAIYIVGFMTILSSILLLYLKRLQRRQHATIEAKLTEMKFRFFTNVSHELRTPLTLIITPLESLRRRLNEMSTEMIDTQLAVIDGNAQRLLTLVNRLLDFRKLEMGQQKLELSSGDFYEFVRSACEAFMYLSKEKSIGLGCAIPNKSLYMMFDKNKMQHILSNLLSNAFKFTPEGGNIAVSVQSDENRVRITVRDTGCGINEHDLPHIFERFYQSQESVENTQAGTGIGLNMVSEMVKLHGGSISVKSEVGKGTTFCISIPITQATIEPSISLSEGEELEEKLLSGHLLIVDDNEEFRQFLVNELSVGYNVMQAADGVEAMKIIGEHDIDLVVSDVMMPHMDGMEMCRRLKTDVSTSHIMVILLTARTAEEVKLEGFRSGADDYLSKPFNMEILQLRISQLIERRRQNIEKMRHMLQSPVSKAELPISDIDCHFIADAKTAVEKNLSNDAFDVEELASLLCMSRSTLYRKLVSLTGQKPTEFIRTIRLAHAAKLILEGHDSLTDIGYMCGFSSTSYFYRCFKKQYGVQPGNYKE